MILLYDFFVNTLYRMKYENNIYFSNESDLTITAGWRSILFVTCVCWSYFFWHSTKSYLHRRNLWTVFRPVVIFLSNFNINIEVEKKNFENNTYNWFQKRKTYCNRFIGMKTNVIKIKKFQKAHRHKVSKSFWFIRLIYLISLNLDASKIEQKENTSQCE